MYRRYDSRRTNFEMNLAPGQYYCSPTSGGRYNIWRRPVAGEDAYRVAIATTSAGPYKGTGYEEKANKAVAEEIVRSLNAARVWGAPTTDVEDA